MLEVSCSELIAIKVKERDFTCVIYIYTCVIYIQFTHDIYTPVIYTLHLCDIETCVIYRVPTVLSINDSALCMWIKVSTFFVTFMELLYSIIYFQTCFNFCFYIIFLYTWTNIYHFIIYICCIINIILCICLLLFVVEWELFYNTQCTRGNKRLYCQTAIKY